MRRPFCRKGEIVHSLRKHLEQLRVLIDKTEESGLSEKSFAQAVAEARREEVSLKSKLSP